MKGPFVASQAGSTGSHSSQVGPEVVRVLQDRDDRRSRTQPPRVGREPLGRRRRPHLLQHLRMRAVGTEDRPPPGRHLDDVEIAGRVTGDGDPVQIGQLGAVRVEGVADLQQARRLGVTERLQPGVRLRRQRGDVPPDVRVGAFVDERDAGRVTDEPESGTVDDTGVHGDTPFDAQAEPEPRLCAKGTSVAADVTGTGAMDSLERPAERLRRAVAVPDGDAQQVVLATDDVGDGGGHTATADVLRQRHSRQRREHPAKVVLGRAERLGVPGDVEFVGEVFFDQVDELVEGRNHVASLRRRL